MERLLRRFRRGGGDPNVTRIRRRQTLVRHLSALISLINLALFVAGYVWMLVIPLPNLGRFTYIDENALQPGQVTTYFDWGNVHTADLYLTELESLRDSNATSAERASYITTQFKRLGLPAASQAYKFDANAGSLKGVNAYAAFPSPRSSGTEAIVISASWLSRSGNDTLNLRGIATILALADYLKKYSLWAKDLVFVVSDGYLDGMQAWLNAYHSTPQSNLKAEELTLTSGVIWTALHIDYPGHSFSHLGIFHEGVNGRLTNQDLVNSFERIARSSGVPTVLYDHIDWRDNAASRAELEIIPPWVPSFLRDNHDVQTYAFQAKNVLRHVGYQARGQPSGVHGLFHQFRIDSFTIFAVPATGPHGFHAIGRIVESTLRTANNLLERLHASFFFYILTGPYRFLKIGLFLPSAILISVAMMFSGLKIWTDAGWVRDDSPTDNKTNSPQEQWTTRKRPVLSVLRVMISTHIIGALVFWLITRSVVINSQSLLALIFLGVSTLPMVFVTLFPSPSAAVPTSSVLKAFSLCLASTVISTTAVLNFSLAALLAILLGVPMTSARRIDSVPIGVAVSLMYTSLAFGWLVWPQAELRSAVWNWDILGVWTAPFISIVYAPLMLQSSIVCLS
ncbi:Glycosyl phosphatidyl inositol protein transamidase complex subunit [Pleurotus ostreatus]|uniref:Glycosyl phosphatidyl inositol protein transamidase complex subunit n=1 Tax=Pleurotus ostreatus TaxID=5322 RepID=A0A8H7A2A6_PLEOS|nr:Glycosyl phosphatidyl inositol protein transamidase complex subunit [Pleurotus ostreatus]KAF7440683.1 Glycosyl phosphatidyl inositol protein transamidase complex subunit [Pleurotus ostreatus]KAJ8699927.1 Glycosyl phosphatidyl inositol protein transamidase complex subunit [Pleurotus ostreatus]